MTRTRLSQDLLPATEKQVVAACVQRFQLAGWYAVPTEANNVGRGKTRSGKARPGVLPPGFPDYLFTLGLGNGLGLVAVVEFKNSSGGVLSAAQRRMHQNLHQNYQQTVHVVRNLEDAEAVIALGDRMHAALIEAGLA